MMDSQINHKSRNKVKVSLFFKTNFYTIDQFSRFYEVDCRRDLRIPSLMKDLQWLSFFIRQSTSSRPFTQVVTKKEGKRTDECPEVTGVVTSEVVSHWCVQCRDWPFNCFSWWFVLVDKPYLISWVRLVEWESLPFIDEVLSRVTGSQACRVCRVRHDQW